MSWKNRPGKDLPFSSLPFRKRYMMEMKDSIQDQSTNSGNGQGNFQSSETKKEKDQGANRLVEIIPGVIRHTSNPTHLLAYYYSLPSK